MNKIHIIGCLTKDPELTTTHSGVTICRFTVAVNRNFKGANGQEVDFIPVVAWRERGELCSRYLSKGKKCYIGGSLNLRSYETNEGGKRFIAEIIAEEVEFLTPKSATELVQQKPVKQTLAELVEDDDDGLPF